MKLSQPQIKVLAGRLAAQINEKIDIANKIHKEQQFNLIQDDLATAVADYNLAVKQLISLRLNLSPSFTLLSTHIPVSSWGDYARIDGDLDIDETLKPISIENVEKSAIAEIPAKYQHISPATLADDIIYRTIEYNDLDLLCADLVKHFTPDLGGDS